MSEIETQKLMNFLIDMDRIGTRSYIDSLAAKTSYSKVIETIIAKTLEEVGKKWEEGILSLSQVYMSGRICEELVDEILPPGNNQRKNQPKMAITVFEDSHMLGKRIVYATIRSAGFYITDYGKTDIKSLTAHLHKDTPEILFISVLMLPSALHLKAFICELRKDFPSTKVIVGGAPFLYDEGLWKEIGADAMGHTATDAIMILEQVMKEK